ncbi:MAG: ribosome recycling factor [Caldisericaceae bacterium]|nr:ribosome recycling factor [Caldisericaceae bacterium]
MEKKFYEEVESRMKAAIEALERDFSKVRATRITPEILEPVKVEAYGTLLPIRQVANISSSGSRSLLIEPWDKSLLKEIERGILKANLGVTPQNDGSTIRLNFPKLDEEERERIATQVKKMAEEFREEIRSIRRKAIEQVREWEKNKEISEDEKYRMQDKIQELTDKYIEIINDHLKKKEKEILEV